MLLAKQMISRPGVYRPSVFDSMHGLRIRVNSKFHLVGSRDSIEIPFKCKLLPESQGLLTHCSSSESMAIMEMTQHFPIWDTSIFVFHFFRPIFSFHSFKYSIYLLYIHIKTPLLNEKLTIVCKNLFNFNRLSETLLNLASQNTEIALVWGHKVRREYVRKASRLIQCYVKSLLNHFTMHVSVWCLIMSIKLEHYDHRNRMT